jgi:tetratricopeptide (TPR) repeat protein
MPKMRAAAPFLIAGLLAAYVPAPAEGQGTADPYYEFLIARRLEGDGNTAGAVAALERAAAADPKSAEVRAEIASLYLRQNQAEAADKAARAALLLDEKNADANRVLGLLEAAQVDAERNGSAQANTHIATAITYLERAVSGSQGLPDANLNYTLGRLYLRGGFPDKAIEPLMRVLNQNPGSVQGRLALAQAQAAARDLPAAIATLDEILADEPRVAAALAQYQEQAGRPKDAASTYTTALAQQPGNRELKVRRIVALYDAKDFAKAAQFATDAQQQHPEDSRFPRLQASAYYAAGDKTRAIAVLEASSRTFPKDAIAQMSLADMYSSAGRKADAEKTVRQVLTNDPSNADAMTYLAYMLANRGDHLDEAIQLVTRALQTDPQNGAYLDSLGWAHFQRGDLDDAAKYLAAAAEKLPRNAEVQTHLGDLEAKRGRWSEAIVAWTRALDTGGDAVDRAALEKKITDARRRTRP